MREPKGRAQSGKSPGMDEKVRLFFDGLSDAHRIRMVDMLLEREMNVSAICGHFPLKQPSVSHHLKALKKGGALKARKSGKEVYYSVNRKYVSSIMTYYFARWGFMVKDIDDD